MAKYPISKQFFPFNLFTPPISEGFLARVVPFMKPPRNFAKTPGFTITDLDVESFDGAKVPCFMISPEGLDAAEPAPVLVYFHGGGFVLEAAAFHYANALHYAREADCKVVFPLYRLAPAHPFPIFHEDCYATLRTVYERAGELGVDRGRIALGGDSAGADLAVGVMLMAQDRGLPVRFAGQMLIYPFLDARNSSESARRFTDTPMWNSELSRRIGPMTQVAPETPGYVYYSPLEAGDNSVAKLPPAYVETAEFDCLHDDGVSFAARLQAAGVEVELNETRGTMHGFDIVQRAPITQAALRARVEWLKRVLEENDW